uniref:Putative secreted protein n=1 Tax=Ixodes ricinus TaxID=34613 RepID=V5HG55_IXORI
MFRNISNMLFVLFALVLGLPASLGERFLSGMIPAHHCQRGIDPAGQIFCQLAGLQDLTAYHLRTCQVRCLGSARKLRLPNGRLPQEWLGVH